jgi:hypothetical protein
MGKRSDFARRNQDAYMTTDTRAVQALLPYLEGIESFAEPCAGEHHMSIELERAGLYCAMFNDIAWKDGKDALKIADFGLIDAIITNPPWTRQLLHPMILHFIKFAPTWLLFDSDWAYTMQARHYLPYCSDIVPTPRLKWITGSKHTSKDNTSWYRFSAQRSPTIFHARSFNSKPNAIQLANLSTQRRKVA